MTEIPILLPQGPPSFVYAEWAHVLPLLHARGYVVCFDLQHCKVGSCTCSPLAYGSHFQYVFFPTPFYENFQTWRKVERIVVHTHLYNTQLYHEFAFITLSIRQTCHPSIPLIFIVLFKSNIFEIIIDSRTLIRNHAKKYCVPFIQFFPVITSCKTRVEYYRQDTGIDTGKIQNISITTRTLHVTLFSSSFFFLVLLIACGSSWAGIKPAPQQ